MYDTIIIGGGPAGLSSAISAKENGSDVLLIEREERLGGILKQCIHDGFGLTRYGQQLTGPEYAYRDIEKVESLGIDTALNTFVLDAKKDNETFVLTLTNNQGIHEVRSRSLVLAMGCRERTAKQIFIHGDRPSGIFTAGSAQHLVNLMGYLPGRRCVILGSGDIGLIMARRLTLEGAEVLGVFEAKPKPSGLQRNISQCLNDFDIPLYLSKTVTRTIGKDRLEKVEIMDVDEKMRPIEGSEQYIDCDTLILSVGLIPENEISEKLGVKLSPRTKGPLVDECLETMVDGIFAAGNCLSVNDLVDYVSENGTIAGRNASEYAKSHSERNLIEVKPIQGILSIVPQYINLNGSKLATFYIRSDNDYRDMTLSITHKDEAIFTKKLHRINQAESIRVDVDLKNIQDDIEVKIC